MNIKKADNPFPVNQSLSLEELTIHIPEILSLPLKGLVQAVKSVLYIFQF